MTSILPEIFDPPMMATNGLLGMLERLAEIGDFFFHQQAGHGGLEVVRNALSRGVRAVRGAEGVVHVDLGQRGQRLGEGRIVGLFFGVEAQVFEQQHLARLELARHLFGNFADAIGRKGHVDALAEFLVEQLAQPVDHGPQRVLRIGLALGPAQVRGQDHLGLALRAHRRWWAAWPQCACRR